MAKPFITIIGLGYTGTSLGLALQRGETNFDVVGHDKNMDANSNARKLGAVQRTEWNLHRACEGADLIVLCVPLHEATQLFEHLTEDLRPGVLVLALGSLLQPLLDGAAKKMSTHSHFVAGRPVIPAIGPLAAPRADLFDEAVFALAAGGQTDPAALELASGFVSRIGAQALFVDAHEHDGLMAGVEQTPQLLAAIMMRLSTSSPSWREAQRLAGRSFAQATDLSTPPATLAAVLRTNRSNVLARLDQLQAEIETWRELINSEPGDGKNDPLFASLDAVFDARILWESNVKLKRWDADTAPTLAAPAKSSGSMLRQMLLGGLTGRKGDPAGKK